MTVTIRGTRFELHRGLVNTLAALPTKKAMQGRSIDWAQIRVGAEPEHWVSYAMDTNFMTVTSSSELVAMQPDWRGLVEGDQALPNLHQVHALDLPAIVKELRPVKANTDQVMSLVLTNVMWSLAPVDQLGSEFGKSGELQDASAVDYDMAYPLFTRLFTDSYNCEPTNDRVNIAQNYLSRIAGLIGNPGGPINEPLRLRLTAWNKPINLKTGNTEGLLMPARMGPSEDADWIIKSA